MMAVDSFWNLHGRDRSKIFLYRHLFCVFREECVAQREKKSSNLELASTRLLRTEKRKTLLNLAIPRKWRFLCRSSREMQIL